jgi:hypothetical protein
MLYMQACSSTMWVLALLAISSSLLASPAAAQLGAYAFHEPGAYSFGEPGAYSLMERSEPGAYSLMERSEPGAYSLAERSTPGGYSFAEPGGYSFGADIPIITLDDLAALPEQQLQQLSNQQRHLLAVSELTVPASITASSGDSSSNLELDIVPAELPASKSWESQNWQSWEEWYTQHFNTHPDVGGAGAYGMSVAGDYGQGSYGHGSYGSSYGSEGAYFDFRSNRAFVPEQAVNHAAPDSTMLPAGALVHLPSSGSGAGARFAEQQLHMGPTTPTLAGVSRGRGLSLGLSNGQESAAGAGASSAGSFTGQANLAALNLQAPEQQMGPARRLLVKAADVLSVLAGPFKLSEAAAAPGYFARRLHMVRSN